MQLYVINLDRRPDRLDFFSRQAARLGISFQRISAVDGRTVDFDERARALGHGAILGQEIGPFALACFESHRKAWTALVESGDRHAMVMEDDMVLTEDFARIMDDGWVMPDADLIRFETFPDLSGKFDRQPAARVAGRGLHRMRSSMLNAGAYLLTAKAARALLAGSAEKTDAVDAFLFHQNSPMFAQMVIYQMIPAPAIQGDRLETMQGSNWTASSLRDERTEIAATVAPRESAAKRGLREKLFTPLWKLKAWASGMIHERVPFG